jgi:hypothetical protein
VLGVVAREICAGDRVTCLRSDAFGLPDDDACASDHAPCVPADETCLPDRVTVDRSCNFRVLGGRFRAGELLSPYSDLARRAPAAAQQSTEVATSALRREVLVLRRARHVHRTARLVMGRAVHAMGAASLVLRIAILLSSPTVLVFRRAFLVLGIAIPATWRRALDARTTVLAARTVLPAST